MSHFRDLRICLVPQFEQGFPSEVGGLGVTMGALDGGNGCSRMWQCSVPQHLTPRLGLPASVDADVGQRFDFLLPGPG